MAVMNHLPRRHFGYFEFAHSWSPHGVQCDIQYHLFVGLFPTFVCRLASLRDLWCVANTKVAKIPRHTPKILERSLAIPQRNQVIGIFDVSPRIFQGSLGCAYEGIFANFLYCLASLRDLWCVADTKVAKIPPHTPKILETSLATRQRSHKETKG